MRDQPSALVGGFIALLQQAGCRGMCTALRNEKSGTIFSNRDVETIEAGAEALPGAWRVEASGDGDTAGRVWLRPLANSSCPSYVFDRRDGFITIRQNRGDEAGKARSLVFGVFVSVIIAVDAIAHDIHMRNMAASVQ